MARERPTASYEQVRPTARDVAGRATRDVLDRSQASINASAHWTAPADRDHVGVLRRQVAAFALDAGMPADDVAEVRIAVSEALTNAAMHAYRDRDFDGDVSVDAEVAGDELLVRVRDYGTGIAPRADSPGYGQGLSIIARLCKRCSARRCAGGGTEVSMCFDLVRDDSPPRLV